MSHKYHTLFVGGIFGIFLMGFYKFLKLGTLIKP